MTFLNICCCVLLPTLFTLYCTWTPPTAERRQQQRRDASVALPPDASWAERASRQCSWLSAAADGTLEQALGHTALQRLCVCLYLVVLCWWGARATAGL